jgi:uncharacterized membrane protein SirB2
MWHALRAELAYFLPWLLGGLGIAAGVGGLLIAIIFFVPSADGAPGFLPEMFLIIAGMVVAFIAQSYRSEERRARLLLAGPLTPRQLAGVMVLLPACLVGLGALVAVLKFGLFALVTGKVELADLAMAGSFTGEFMAYAQMGPLAQEASAARRQRRARAAIVGWAVFVGAILLLAVSMLFRNSIHGYLGQLVALLTAMAVGARLYQGRTDFTT